jgi:hypothetical protein
MNCRKFLKSVPSASLVLSMSSALADSGASIVNIHPPIGAFLSTLPQLMELATLLGGRHWNRSPLATRMVVLRGSSECEYEISHYCELALSRVFHGEACLCLSSSEDGARGED